MRAIVTDYHEGHYGWCKPFRELSYRSPSSAISAWSLPGITAIKVTLADGTKLTIKRKPHHV